MSDFEAGNLFFSEESEAGAYGHIVRVAFESGVDNEFDYAVPDELWPVKAGQRVEAPFGRGNKRQVGFCVEADVPVGESFGGGKRRGLKRVSRVIDERELLDAELMSLARWMSGYYVCPLGQVLAAMVPAAVKKGAGAKTERYVYLAAGAEKSLEQLRGKKQKQVVELLQERKAFGSGSAIEIGELVVEAGCSEAPVKRLAEELIIKIGRRTVLRSLPAIPEGLSVRAERIVLNEDQRKVLGHIKEQIDTGRFGVTLLHGVTDSGKTELYIRAIEEVLRKGKRAIVLLPEIALTAQTVERFSKRFERIAVMHSGLTGAQRNVQWQKIRAGEAEVVIGARSAVFAPVSELGLIIVDEEHESSYKQDTVPRYNGRDVAIKRAQLAGAHCVLGSATPSLEMLVNCRRKKHFSLVSLPKRVMGLSMPEMRLVDLGEEFLTARGGSLISEALGGHLREVLSRGEQAILLLNRRGYSSFVFCPSCKHSVRCRNCDAALTFHKSDVGKGVRTVGGRVMDYGYAVCHYCMARTLVPEKCALCGAGMTMIGLGSQRLEEELGVKFPDAHVSRVDSDSMAGRDYYRVLRDFSEGRIDILAGTQMLAKGLHFPNVTLVGIINADTCLYLPDFRANERTFQLICQVAGRAGRSRKKGVVFVQTFLPEQAAIQFALAGDFEGFVDEELKHRQACDLPPFWRLGVIGLRDRDFERLESACNMMREVVDFIVAREGFEVKVRGPMPAMISRIQRMHRMQIVIQSPDAEIMQKFFGCLRAAGPVRPAVKVAIDVDPVNLL